MPQSSGAGNAAFAQQGTVDWTALSRSSFTFSVEVMSRFSKAGVEMITCAMSQAMCSQFNVPPEGQKRVTDAISKLKAYSSYGQILWFGFGVKHIVRSLCETKQGATCAALCACLRVSYSTEMSARVLSVLCDQLLPSDGLSPALPQWSALVDVCSGVLSPSKFPVMVDGFCRLALPDRGHRSHRYNATTVDALAHALAELSKVSNGSVSGITFQGGYDCAWIAAVAEWLLCLKVKVLTKEGDCLYWQDSNHTNGSAPVVVIFNTQTHDLHRPETTKLEVVNRTFYLPYNGIMELLQLPGDGGEVFVMGRSSWSTILEDTFGCAFKILLSSNTIVTFAKFLLSGTTTRYMTLDGMSHYHRIHPTHPWMGSFSSPAGSRVRAFFLALANRLPELSPLLGTVEHLEKSTGAAVGPKVKQLLEYCLCHKCSSTSCLDICLHPLAETLINLILLLAHIDIDEGLQPASTGLLLLYLHVVRSQTHTSDHMTERFSGKENNINNTYRRIFELFTGLSSHTSVHKFGTASAICHGGVCIWLPALEDPLYDPTTQMRLRVVPGKVSFRGRLYREIVDTEESLTSGPVRSGTYDLIMRKIAMHGPSRGCTLVIRETFDASQLEAWIELRAGRTSRAFNTYLNHREIWPREFPSELRLRIAELYGTMYDQIDNNTCEVNLGSARSQSLPKPDLTTWERPCPCLALTIESTAPPRRSYNYPEPGEWVVVSTDSGPMVRLFRGDFTLLYYLMSARSPNSAICLSCFDGCIRCLAYSFAEEAFLHYQGCQIEIHTITADQCTCWSAKMAGTLPKEERVNP